MNMVFKRNSFSIDSLEDMRIEVSRLTPNPKIRIYFKSSGLNLYFQPFSIVTFISMVSTFIKTHAKILGLVYDIGQEVKPEDVDQGKEI
jgi:hypothetical protein